MRTNKFSIGGLIGVHVISIVNEAIKTIFLRKDFERAKTQIKPKPTNKNTKKRTKTTKGTIFHAYKFLRGEN